MVVAVHGFVHVPGKDQFQGIRRVFDGVLDFFPVFRGEGGQHIIRQIPAVRLGSDPYPDPFEFIRTQTGNDILDAVVPPALPFSAPGSVPDPG